MNLKQTGKVVDMLKSWYQLRNDTDDRTLISNWHLILEPYEYETVMEAVLHFARTDKRDYPSFPTPAQIINGIQTIEQTNKIKMAKIAKHLIDGKAWDIMTPELQKIITEEDYNEILTTWDVFEMINKSDQLKQQIWLKNYYRRHPEQ